MELRNLKPVLSGMCMAVIFTGCLLGEDEKAEAPLRTYENGVYTDRELGYRIAFPPGWIVDAPTDYESLGLDVVALGTTPPSKTPPEVVVWRDSLFYGTLRERVELYHDNENSFRDSSAIRAAEIRGGVEVIPVDEWYYLSYFTQKTRFLYFERRGYAVRIGLTHASANFDTSSQLRFVDSSLSFF
jgi:hypothetical protein